MVKSTFILTTTIHDNRHIFIVSSVCYQPPPWRAWRNHNKILKEGITIRNHPRQSRQFIINTVCVWLPINRFHYESVVLETLINLNQFNAFIPRKRLKFLTRAKFRKGNVEVLKYVQKNLK